MVLRSINHALAYQTKLSKTGLLYSDDEASPTKNRFMLQNMSVCAIFRFLPSFRKDCMKHVRQAREKDEMWTDLAAGGIVVFVRHHALRQFLPAAQVGVRECTSKPRCKPDVVVAASPPEVAVWLVTWCRATSTPDGRACAAGLSDGVCQGRTGQSVDERLLATPCNTALVRAGSHMRCAVLCETQMRLDQRSVSVKGSSFTRYFSTTA